MNEVNVVKADDEDSSVGTEQTSKSAREDPIASMMQNTIVKTA